MHHGRVQQGVGERALRRDPEQGQRAGQRVRRVRERAGPGGGQGGQVLGGPEQIAGPQFADREQVELQLGGEADRGAAAEGPQRLALDVVVAVVADAVSAPHPVDVLDRAQRGRGEAERAGQPADSPVEGVAADADGRGGPAEREQVVGFGLFLDLGPRHPGADAGGPRLRIDRHRVERGGVDQHQPAAERGACAVSGRLYADAEPQGPGEGHRGGHVVGGSRAHDGVRALREAAVVGGGGRCVLLGAGGEHGLGRRTRCNASMMAPRPGMRASLPRGCPPAQWRRRPRRLPAGRCRRCRSRSPRR